MARPEWERKVIKDLKKYHPIKASIEILKSELSGIAESSMSLSLATKSSRKKTRSDPTGKKAVKRMESGLADEIRRREKFISKLDLAINALPPEQRFIIKEKFYLRDRGRDDVEIKYGRGEKSDTDVYMHPQFNLNSTRYFELKYEAYRSLAIMLGYLSGI